MIKLLICGVLTATAAPAAAQVSTATLNANLGTVARLSFSSNSLAFPDADPDLSPVVTAIPSPISITAKARASMGETVTLTVQASDDLRSAMDTIDAANITWTASGAGFTGGTLSKSPQLVASWPGSGVRSGTQTYFFRNQWTYATGTYTVTLLYTLSAP